MFATLKTYGSCTKEIRAFRVFKVLKRAWIGE